MQTNEKPLITVLLPVFNAMPFLPEALDSLLRQTEERIRILAIDDGSTDQSVAYLRSVKDPRLEVVEQPHTGLVAALNRGLAATTTSYVARMDADDVCDVRRLRLQLQYLESHPDCLLVGCSANHIGMRGGLGVWPINMPTVHEEIVTAMLQRKSAIIHPTAMFRLAPVRETGGYSETIWPSEDYELFLRLGLHGQLANLPECLYSIRLHQSSITARSIVFGQRKFDDVRRLYLDQYRAAGGANFHIRRTRRLVDEIALGLDSRAVYLYRKGMTRWVNGSKSIAIPLISLSTIFSPWRTLEYVRRRHARRHGRS